MEATELKQRTKSFALRYMRLTDSLPPTNSSRVIASQLLRSSTSVAVNNRAACRALSGAEFASTMGIVEEEIDQSALGMELIIESKLAPAKVVHALWQKSDEPIRIAVASIQTAKHKPIQNPKSELQNP